jgi:hypothetical protein
VPVCIGRIPPRRPDLRGLADTDRGAAPSAEPDVLVDERGASARAAESIERAGVTTDLSALIAPPAALTVGRRLAMRRPARRPEWQFNASCLVKRLPAWLAADRDRASRTSESGCGHGRILARRG